MRGDPTNDPAPKIEADPSTFFASEAPGTPVTDEMLRSDDRNPDSWLQYNKGYRQRGYTPAARLTPANVDSLQRVYEFTLGGWSLQTEPIVVPGDPPVLYATSDIAEVIAVNARTGETYWKSFYEPDNYDGFTGKHRGAAVYGDSIIVGAPDTNVVAFDRYTGEQRWVKSGLSQRQQNKLDYPNKQCFRAAPLVYDGTVILGQTGGFSGWGAVVAHDAESGERLWDFDITDPETWVGESWRYGDGAPWMTAAVDPDSGLVFVPAGNPAPRNDGYVRTGPNKHTGSLIALDSATGELVWSHQLVAHDYWDWDVTVTPRVIDLLVDGERRRVVNVEDKSGFSYFIDAKTGRLLERTEPFAHQGGELEFMELPPLGKENALSHAPGETGGTAWPPDAYSPQTGLLYLGANDAMQAIYWDDGARYRGGTVKGGGDAIDYPSFEEECRLTAIDPTTGKTVWTHRYEGLSNDDWHRSGGTTATGGGLVFGTSVIGKVVALDATTGEQLWSDNPHQKFTNAGPVIWDDPADGRQYMAVGTGDSIVVWAGEGPDPTPMPTRTTSSKRSTAGTTASHSGSTTGEGPGMGVVTGVAGLSSALALRRLRNRRQNDGDT